MAYATIRKPIPTIQWEGWREGINDVRYITLLLNEKLLPGGWVEKNCMDSVTDCRKNIIDFLRVSKVANQ